MQDSATAMDQSCITNNRRSRHDYSATCTACHQGAMVRSGISRKPVLACCAEQTRYEQLWLATTGRQPQTQLNRHHEDNGKPSVCMSASHTSVAVQGHEDKGMRLRHGVISDDQGDDVPHPAG
jgi:hypothetical protein